MFRTFAQPVLGLEVNRRAGRLARTGGLVVPHLGDWAIDPAGMEAPLATEPRPNVIEPWQAQPRRNTPGDWIALALALALAVFAILIFVVAPALALDRG